MRKTYKLHTERIQSVLLIFDPDHFYCKATVKTTEKIHEAKQFLRGKNSPCRFEY